MFDRFAVFVSFFAGLMTMLALVHLFDLPDIVEGYEVGTQRGPFLDVALPVLCLAGGFCVGASVFLVLCLARACLLA